MVYMHVALPLHYPGSTAPAYPLHPLLTHGPETAAVGMHCYPSQRSLQPINQSMLHLQQ
jgi:hypothetical protein